MAKNMDRWKAFNAPIYYAKYKKEKSKFKAVMELIKRRVVTEVTHIEEKKVNMRSVILEHCFGGEETTKRRKTPKWILYSFKERRRIT